MEGDELGSEVAPLGVGDGVDVGREVGSTDGWDEVEGDELGSEVAPLGVGDGVDVGREVGDFVGDAVVG